MITSPEELAALTQVRFEWIKTSEDERLMMNTTDSSAASIVDEVAVIWTTKT